MPKQFMLTYHEWCTQLMEHPLYEELQAIKQDATEIEDRFYKHLEFGTGGMRGIMGVGSNRMNIFTVRKATQGLANHLKKAYPQRPTSVAIAYDTRFMSREFALEAALVLAQNHIKAYLFMKVAPTPLLSYAVRELQTSAGIVITASHNPKEYNGYKVYNSLGGQITDALAADLTQEILAIENEFSITIASEAEAVRQDLLIWLGDELLDRYLNITKELLIDRALVKEAASQLKIIYTPLYGTGLVPVQRILEDNGFSNLYIVPEQAMADSNFTHILNPNPEDPTACALALKTGEARDADVVLATDPDADRVGVMVKDAQGCFTYLTGNQTGALLIDYILQAKHRSKTLPPRGAIIKTIVTSEMGRAIAESYGVKTVEVLTGFKYIGEKIEAFKEQKSYQFLFGYEESYGYLIGDHVRDKDAVQTILLIAEMALSWHQKGLTLSARLHELYQQFGYYQEELITVAVPGQEGLQRIAQIMAQLRQGLPKTLQALKPLSFCDYLPGKQWDLVSGQQTPLDLPTSNVLYYAFEEGSWCCIRPSGTEPKLKIYLGVCGKGHLEAKQTLAELKAAFLQAIEH